jgi:DNA-binding transcriptional MocR family regulator
MIERRRSSPPTPLQLSRHAYHLAYYKEHGVPPSQRHLAKEWRVNRARVQVVLEELREKGLLDRNGRYYIPVDPTVLTPERIQKILMANLNTPPDPAMVRLFKKAARTARVQKRGRKP